MANLDRNFDLAPLYGVIKTKPAKVCPLTCERDFNMDGERRVKICCGAGSFLDDDKECEKKREKPSGLSAKSCTSNVIARSALM
jgi:hypothetical protein